MGWMNGVLGFNSLRGAGNFSPVQWVPLFLGVKWPTCEADRSPLSSAEVKECIKLYLHSPNMPSWLGAQLKESTPYYIVHD
jgi:hypothetical protein